MPRSRFDEYQKFGRAVSAGDAAVALRYVAGGFRASLGSSMGPGADDLSFREFMDELSRLRNAFPDLGQQIQFRNLRETDATLDVDDVMTVTFTGVLRGRSGRGGELRGDGRVVNIPQHHHVEYDTDGKIIILELTSLQGQTFDHLLS